MQNGSLRGRVAIVTGASRRGGIGAAIARELAADGAAIFFTHWQAYDRTMAWGADDDGPRALEAELRDRRVRCAAMEVDLGQPDAPAGVLDAAEARLGPISILVNNAAYSTSEGYETLDAATIDAHYAVNARATMLLSAGFARRFTAGVGGRIINLTSGQSLGPMPGELAYIASKGAIEAFTRSLAPAVMPLGITVNAVNPGPTDSGWMSGAIKHELVPKFPTSRIGQPDDAARLVAFLASDAAAWITGQVIHSEGGFLRA